MTDRTGDISTGGKVLMPEVVEEFPESILSPEETVLINETVSLINRTISAKALEAAVIIGDHILTRYFNDDIEAAISKDSNKPVSFSILCEHPELNVSRSKLGNMVKVAAQERFLGPINTSPEKFSYSHRLKLTRLPNDENKIEMVRECIGSDMTVRQLEYRVQLKTMALEAREDEAPEPDLAEKTFNALVASIDRLSAQADLLIFEPFTEYIGQMHPDTGEWLKNKIAALVDTLDAAETRCEVFLRKTDPRLQEGE